MGYSITIGKGVELAEGVWDDAEVIERPDAPADGVPTDYTNTRWPSYTGWWQFCEAAELIEVFYEPDGGFKGGHPGQFVITKVMVDRVNQVTKEKFITLEHCHKVRLLWLHYWVNWAYEHCKYPVVQNR